MTSGVIPSWYAPGTLTPAPELRDENAETAGAALFLAEYARATGDDCGAGSRGKGDGIHLPGDRAGTEMVRL